MSGRTPRPCAASTAANVAAALNGAAKSMLENRWPADRQGHEPRRKPGREIASQGVCGTEADISCRLMPFGCWWRRGGLLLVPAAETGADGPPESWERVLSSIQWEKELAFAIWGLTVDS
ncbi:hypothetical protein GCM10010439_42020 [Actinocorallia aurantiaca]|uniref:Uncharacterized protein n=1 Tax=Actinocorallia aurantiaca TaxID=46204 RepID=A0ABN3UCZ4_9ACTN